MIASSVDDDAIYALESDQTTKNMISNVVGLYKNKRQHKT